MQERVPVILNIAGELDSVPEEVLRLAEQAVEAALDKLGFPDGQVDLTLTDDHFIRELNRTYRGIDRPTDVLSFPQWEPDEIRSGLPATDPAPLLGDVVISWPRAVEQARDYGHSLARELSFLAVHGTLHLLGYDHQNEEEEVLMQQLTEEILQSVGASRE